MEKSIHQSTVNLDQLPDSAFLRANQIARSPKHPNTILPFSVPTLWRKVQEGSFPKPLKLSDNVTAWKVGDVRAWLNAQCAE